MSGTYGLQIVVIKETYPLCYFTYQDGTLRKLNTEYTETTLNLQDC